jgi:hypothetical protein
LDNKKKGVGCVSPRFLLSHTIIHLHPSDGDKVITTMGARDDVAVLILGYIHLTCLGMLFTFAFGFYEYKSDDDDQRILSSVTIASTAVQLIAVACRHHNNTKTSRYSSPYEHFYLPISYACYVLQSISSTLRIDLVSALGVVGVTVGLTWSKNPEEASSWYTPCSPKPTL